VAAGLTLDEAPAAVPHGPAAGSASGAAVQLKRLTKRYGQVEAVNGIDLHVRVGEFVTLLGPSGSGKTTTLMMIAGFQDVTSGSILVGGRDITALPPNHRDIGVVFQHYALFPHMRVYDNVAFPLRMRRVGRAEVHRRVSEALRLVQLEGYERRYPRQLSGGQQQRVALARAVVFEPGLALMDEPLGALDRQLREQMQYEIKRLQTTLGITVVYVTHDQGEALVMSDRIAVMNHGRVEQFAPPEELYRRPATTFVATFVGESNLLRGRVRETSADGVLVETEHGLSALGRAAETPPPGAEVVASIRPERLAIDEAPGAAPHVNRVEVRCLEATYAGDASRYIVATGRDEQFVLRVQNRPGARAIAPGDRFAISWAVDDLRVFPASGAEAWTPRTEDDEPGARAGA
jgi:putative spermidine/putrescine transport system ATP-binding protein